MNLAPIDVRFVGEHLAISLLPYHIETKKYNITVLEGFDFDGASIPRVFWSVIGCPFGGLHMVGAFIHDALYASNALSKEECDNVFYELMLANGVDERVAKTMYRAVSMFGHGAYSDTGTKEELRKYKKIVKAVKNDGY